MSMQDPIADMLTRIRNAGSAGLKKVEMPSSREKAAIAKVLKEEGYISDYAVSEDGAKRVLSVVLKYANGKSVIEGIERVSKPSCRIHCGSREIPRVRNGLGTVILTTPSGVLSGRAAAKANVGGEILCYVW
ncbi:30S ribosomal protein S8 [uncultured Victivallis sp.]|uniref:30S ribosomal protein S8 n=1 Tax=uncultured Victivallis sp. TaxID=354118 RepID=UPI0026003970|nr:30S ribosomal protein S8 [uncultured Victivallis sp.]